MQSRNLINLALLGLLLVLGSIALYQPGVEEPKPETSLTQIDPEKITNINIKRSNTTPILLIKEQGEWRLSSPITAQARQYITDEILKLLTATSYKRYPASDFNLEEIGLKNPFLCLWLNEHSFCFGKRTPLEQLRYLQVGNQIHLITDTLSHQLTDNYAHYISHRLLPESSNITRLQLPQLTLDKQDGDWQLSPAKSSISTEQKQQLIDAWKHSRALSVSHYTPQIEKDIITLSLDGDQQLTFQVVSTEPEFILANSALGIQYHLTEGSLDKLTRLTSDEPN